MTDTTSKREQRDPANRERRSLRPSTDELLRAAAYDYPPPTTTPATMLADVKAWWRSRVDEHRRDRQEPGRAKRHRPGP